MGDVVLFSTYYMSDKFSSSLHDDGPQTVMVASFEKFSNGDVLRPE